MNKKFRIAITSLTISGLGIIVIANNELFVGKAYQDAVGVTTIGYGTTSGVKMGDKITPERALMRLGKDVSVFESNIKACIGDVPLSQNEWDAYVDLTYNIGSGAFCRSTIVKKLKQSAPDYNGACKAILPFNKAGGRVLKGLVVRREQEFKKCMGE